jgi:4-hydroxy-3-polyprenylbenzoate decarboxylase
MKTRHYVLAITGASGAVYARRCMQLLAQHAANQSEVECHLVASSAARQVWSQELGEDMPGTVEGLRCWANDDFSAPFASGSNPATATLVAPCSMSSLGRVAHGTGTGLIHRACDVALKERKPLILLARETPLSTIHLRNMTTASEAGAVILPAVPSFYVRGADMGSAIDSVVARALDHMGIPHELLPRWGQST